MELERLETFLKSENIECKPTVGGILANLGFLIGRIYIKYDPHSKTYDFNDKARWYSEAFILAIMFFFLFWNMDIYSEFQRYACIAVTIGMIGILGYKEKRIYRLKQKIFNSDLNQSKESDSKV